MPREKSCAPLKMLMIEARNGKPGTLPSINARTTVKTNTPIPNKVNVNPIKLEILNGIVLKPVRIIMAYLTSLIKS